eukprot:133185_1
MSRRKSKKIKKYSSSEGEENSMSTSGYIYLRVSSAFAVLHFLLCIYHSWSHYYFWVHMFFFAFPLVSFVIGFWLFLMLWATYTFSTTPEEAKDEHICELYFISFVPNIIIFFLITWNNLDIDWLGILCTIVTVIYCFVCLIGIIKGAIKIEEFKKHLVWWVLYVVVWLLFINSVHWYQYNDNDSNPNPENIGSTQNNELNKFMKTFEEIHPDLSPDIIALISDLKMQNIELYTEIKQLKSSQYCFFDMNENNTIPIKNAIPSNFTQQKIKTTSVLLTKYNDMFSQWDTATKQLESILLMLNSEIYPFTDGWFNNFVLYKQLINEQQKRLELTVKYAIDLFQQEHYLKNNITKKENEKAILHQKISETTDDYRSTKKKK